MNATSNTRFLQVVLWGLLMIMGCAPAPDAPDEPSEDGGLGEAVAEGEGEDVEGGEAGARTSSPVRVLGCGSRGTKGCWSDSVTEGR